MQGKPRPRVDGFTPEQRFFIAYAEAWRTKVRPETKRTRAISDPHSPEQWRVNGVVANMPELVQAFGCNASDPMVRPPAQLRAYLRDGGGVVTADSHGSFVP